MYQEQEKNKLIKKRQGGIIRAKSDFFRSARYGLTLQEHRIIYYAILTGQQTNKPFEPVTLSVTDFTKLCEVKGKDYYRVLRNLSKKLVGRVVEVAYKDKDGTHLLQAPWLTGITYHAREGAITIKLNKELQPFFEGKPFTESEYYFLIRFTCQYSERLYEILKSTAWEKNPILDFDIEDLRQRLKVEATKYPNFANFRTYVLEPAIKDINEFTDIDVSMREKRGYRNKVEIVFFSVEKKSKKDYFYLKWNKEKDELYPPLTKEKQEKLMQELLGEDYNNQEILQVENTVTELLNITGQLDFEGGEKE